MNHRNRIIYLGVRVPEYITPVILERIAAIMEEGKIHPRHHVCDMTVELAAGAPRKEALEHMVRRTALNATDSIYQQLFPQYR